LDFERRIIMSWMDKVSKETKDAVLFFFEDSGVSPEEYNVVENPDGGCTVVFVKEDSDSK
jgi:hypothetical protein